MVTPPRTAPPTCGLQGEFDLAWMPTLDEEASTAPTPGLRVDVSHVCSALRDLRLGAVHDGDAHERRPVDRPHGPSP